MPKATHWIGLLLAAVHVCIVGDIVWHIVYAGEPDWPMYWLLLMGIDLPVFPILILMSGIAAAVLPDKIPGLSSPFNDVFNFQLPLVILGIFGTLWWYFLPALLLGCGRWIAARWHRGRDL